MSETHLVKGEKYKLTSFVEHHNSYSSNEDKKPRGGISCFIKSELIPFISEIRKDVTGHIRLKFTNGSVVFSSYIAPLDSPYADPMDFTNVANTFYSSDEGSIIFGGGDLNGRVGDVPQTITPFGGLYRKNCDHVLNEHGREIIRICESFSCYVINNLNIHGKQFEGDFTFRKGNRTSQNDIILANKTALTSIISFKIHKDGWNPSDHYPISVKCCMTFTKSSTGLSASKDILTERVKTAVDKPKKICKSDVDWKVYTELVKNDFKHYKNTVFSEYQVIKISGHSVCGN